MHHKYTTTPHPTHAHDDPARPHPAYPDHGVPVACRAISAWVAAGHGHRHGGGGGGAQGGSTVGELKLRRWVQTDALMPH